MQILFSPSVAQASDKKVRAGGVAYGVAEAINYFQELSGVPLRLIDVIRGQISPRMIDYRVINPEKY